MYVFKHFHHVIFKGKIWVILLTTKRLWRMAACTTWSSLHAFMSITLEKSNWKGKLILLEFSFNSTNVLVWSCIQVFHVLYIWCACLEEIWRKNILYRSIWGWGGGLQAHFSTSWHAIMSLILERTNIEIPCSKFKPPHRVQEWTWKLFYAKQSTFDQFFSCVKVNSITLYLHNLEPIDNIFKWMISNQVRSTCLKLKLISLHPHLIGCEIRE